MEISKKYLVGNPWDLRFASLSNFSSDRNCDYLAGCKAARAQLLSKKVDHNRIISFKMDAKLVNHVSLRIIPWLSKMKRQICAVILKV
jgi:hypothetical protein